MKQKIFDTVNEVVCESNSGNEKNRSRITIVTKYGNKYITTYYDWQQHQSGNEGESDVICEIKGGGQLHIGIEDIESIII